LLRQITSGFTDTADITEKKPFITYQQKVKNGQTMTTKLDYIFIDEDYAHLCHRTETRYGNSDHLLIPRMKEEIIEELLNVKCKEDWDLFKTRIQSIFRAYKPPPKPESRLQKLNK
ncbi:11033_t:CDS:2, partial [Scutellospora calospora]